MVYYISEMLNYIQKQLRMNKIKSFLRYGIFALVSLFSLLFITKFQLNLELYAIVNVIFYVVMYKK